MSRLGRNDMAAALENQDEAPLWARVSEVVAARMGLHFPAERITDLQRGLAGASREFGFNDLAHCAEWLVSTSLNRAQLQVLATHLTIGETYFFRERKTLDVLTRYVLPPLIAARRGGQQRLRLWSAACCTGEEAYSLAILLHQVLPDLADWHVTILATDINAAFLNKAVVGSYGEWSFRDAPARFKEQYFTRTGDRRYTIRPEIQRLVTFEHLNLVDDAYPSLATATNAMDIIFCRNVLMYFSPSQASKVIGQLHHALVEGGWLGVSPSESSTALFPQFVTRNFPGVILFQKADTAARTRAVPPPAAWTPEPRSTVPPEPTPPAEVPTLTRAADLYQQGRYEEVTDLLLPSLGGHTPLPEVCSLLARTLANLGRLADALGWCDRWIATDKVNAAGHYLRGVILLEQGGHDAARLSLQRALYLDPTLVVAHFSLANLARRRGQHVEADKQFANTRHLLGRLHPDVRLPESDGLTAARLTETITALTASGHTS